MNEKSILEQALLQVQTLEEAVKANAKGILASTMKQELNDLLKESIEEEEEKVDEQPDSDEETTDDLPVATGDEDGLDNDESDDSDDDTSNDEPAKDIDSLDSDETDFDTMDDMGDFGGNFSDDDEDDEVVDMSNAGDEEVLKVFKAMKPEDGIIVKKDGDEIEFSDGDDEYIIKLDDEMGDEPDSPNFDEISEEFSDDDSEEISEEISDEDDDEVVYEIELDEDDSNDEEVNEKAKEEEMGESSRTIGNGYHAGIESKTKYMAGNKRDEINEEVSKLRKQNGEYKKALVLFKEKLNEVAVFNANLAYATRLFTESSTTKQEKLNILKRFDSISTLKESKNLYSTIKSELETKKPISESVVEKITSAPSTSSTQVLSESKAYENPQFKRMKDLMTKIK
jgi:hypothetical protein